MNGRKRLGLLFGGRSDEHEVSIASARAVFEHADRGRFSVVPIFIARDGRWVTGPSVRRLLRGHPPAGQGNAAPVTATSPWPGLTKLDVLFPLLHGSFGEDGTIQGLLELLSLPYVGSGVLASALGMDKRRSRQLFEDAGLSVPRTIALHRPTLAEARRAARILGFPVFTKPNRAGSSIGTSLVRSSRALPAAIRAARLADDEVLIEAYLPGREFTVPVLGGRRPRALPVIEIVPTRGFFDLYAKYRGVAAGETIEQCPARIPDALRRRIQAAGIQAHVTLGCRGLTRTDLILSPHGRLSVLEINTIPGFTTESLAPASARAAGISLAALITRLVDEAIRDHGGGPPR